MLRGKVSVILSPASDNGNVRFTGCVVVDAVAFVFEPVYERPRRFLLWVVECDSELPAVGFFNSALTSGS